MLHVVPYTINNVKGILLGSKCIVDLPLQAYFLLLTYVRAVATFYGMNQKMHLLTALQDMLLCGRMGVIPLQAMRPLSQLTAQQD